MIASLLFNLNCYIVNNLLLYTVYCYDIFFNLFLYRMDTVPYGVRMVKRIIREKIVG